MLDRKLFQIIYINLDNRIDRKNSFEESMISANFDIETIERFSAIKDEFGEIGCAKSHFLALSNFICKGSAEYIIILEDDFKISINHKQLVVLLESLRENKINFDMLDMFPHLASVFPIAKLQISDVPVTVFRTMFSRSAAGYIIPRRKAHMFAKLFLKSIDRLEKNRNLLRHEQMRKQMQRHAIDAINILQDSQAEKIHIAFDFEFGTTLDSKSDIREVKASFEDRYNAKTTFGLDKGCPI